MTKGKPKTYISFILDETGSMQTVKAQTISGFNEYVDTLRRDGGKGVRFSLIRFNSEKLNVELAAVKLKNVPELTDESYQPRAATPLYDAIGRTIHALSLGVDEGKHNALVIIQTDGQENASVEYSQSGIAALIKDKKAKGWTFVFLGADQDAWLAGERMGLDEGNVTSYSSKETAKTFRSAAAATTSYLSGGAAQTSNFWDSDDKIAK